jgi:branched-subunit amino acid aminotransferase/4-amino-4-deoxychorismate lyase
LPAEKAAVSVTDAGFQHAVGLFETFQVFHGKPFRLDAHLRRLAGSAKELGLAEQIEVEALATAVRQTIEHNRLARARVRLTLTAGTLSMLKAATPGSGEAPEIEVKRTVAIVPTPPTSYDPAYFTDGATVVIHGAAASPFDENAGHKTLDYWARLRSLRRAAAAGAGEAVWLNVTNHLASGAVSNLLLVKDGVVLTPFARGEEVPGALRAPVLPGVTRAAVIELAHAQGVEVKRQMLTVQDLLDADEVMLTNSGWGVLPVTKVEQREIGDGKVGAMTTALREGLSKLIERETGGD